VHNAHRLILIGESWRLDPQGAQVGEAVELAVADFLDFDPESRPAKSRCERTAGTSLAGRALSALHPCATLEKFPTMMTPMLEQPCSFRCDLPLIGVG
jgi:hypothetical protein